MGIVDIKYKGFAIVEFIRHGKAVVGQKRRSSIQVHQPFGNGYLLKKQVVFAVNDCRSKRRAVLKAKAVVDELMKDKEN